MSQAPKTIGKEANVDWSLWRRWLLANSIGGAAGWLLACIATGATFGIGAAIVGPLSGLLVGSTIGISQALVLISHGSTAIKPQNSGIWIIATIVGGYLGIGSFSGMLFWAYSDFPLQLEDFVLRPLSVFSTLLILGTLQWLLLRSNVRQAGWWIPGSLVAWGLGLAVGIPVARLILGGSVGSFEIWWSAFTLFLAGTIVTLIYGAITGFLLIWLLRRQ